MTAFLSRVQESVSSIALGLIAALLLSLFCAARARADGLRGYLEWEYTGLDTHTEEITGLVSDTKSGGLLQRYYLELDRRIYPNLTLDASGFFERNAIASKTDGVDTDVTLTRVRPTVELRLRTPLYIVEGSYKRNEQKTKVTGSSPVTEIQDTYFTSLLWKPDRFPQLKFLYYGTDNHDRDRQVRDVRDNRFQATAEYRPSDPLYLRYEGTVEDTDNRLEDIQIRQMSHAARVTYSNTWGKGFVSVYSDYDVTWRSTEVTAALGGDVTLSAPSLEGLSSLDDTPDDGALASNPALIDGNFSGSAGINIGLVPPGGDLRLRNAGLRFDTGTDVNLLYLWVDRDLPQAVAGSFSWQVYSSDDNLTWNLVAASAPAPFNDLQNRFEIRFPTVTKRYVKVTVAPLSPTVPGATGFPTILVTELQAAITRPAAEATGRQEQTVHHYNLDVRTRILKVPSVFYEFSYLLRKPDPGSSNWTVSNGLSTGHRFSRKLSGAARVAWEEGREGGKDRTAYIYTASLAASPLETLRHSLVFSGLDETLGGVRQETYSLFLQNNAQLYQGVDVTVGGGLSRQTFDTGEENFTTSVNGLVTLVPNRVMTVNLLYSDRTTDETGRPQEPDQTISTRTGEVNLSLTPLSTIYLFGSWGFVQQSDQKTRRVERYSATFSPFPAGTLHLNFFYSDEYRSQLNQRERIISPGLRWNITRTATLDLSYSDILTDSDISRTESRVYKGDFRIPF